MRLATYWDLIVLASRFSYPEPKICMWPTMSMGWWLRVFPWRDCRDLPALDVDSSSFLSGVFDGESRVLSSRANSSLLQTYLIQARSVASAPWVALVRPELVRGGRAQTLRRPSARLFIPSFQGAKQERPASAAFTDGRQRRGGCSNLIRMKPRSHPGLGCWSWSACS